MNKVRILAAAAFGAIAISATGCAAATSPQTPAPPTTEPVVMDGEGFGEIPVPTTGPIVLDGEGFGEIPVPTTEPVIMDGPAEGMGLAPLP